MAFSHLHVHTEYSLLDGMSTVKELLSRAKELNLSGLAITDHGTMIGARDFYQAARKEAPELKPIIGDEVYVTDGYDHRIEDENNHRTFHLILLAKNLTGYRNLCRIASIGAVEGFYRNKARVSLDVIRKRREGLICLSACIGGEVPSCIIDDDLESAEEIIMTYRDIFGDDYYLEVCEHPNDRPGNPQQVYQWQRKTTEALLEFGRRLGIKVVATNDSHFTLKSQADAHDVMLAMNCGKTLSDTTRLRFTGEEYLKSEEEMLEIFYDHPEVVYNTQEICDKVEVYELEDSESAPCPPVCKGGETPDSALARLAKEGFDRRYGNDPAALQRLNSELSAIRQAGYAANFLFWYDIAAFAGAQNIMLGPGRGTASGSVVNYCLGVTEIEPVGNGLLFERFFNTESATVCNGVDIDVEDGCVGKLWEHLCSTYGKECVAGLVSFSKPDLSGIFRKVAAAMELGQSVIDAAVPLIEGEGETGDLQMMLSRDHYLRKAYGIACELDGRKCGRMANPCAIVVGTEKTADLYPVCMGQPYYRDSPIPLVQYERKALEGTGLFCINLLPLKTLNVIKRTIREVGNIAVGDCVFDSAAQELMRAGDTDGVFQFESGLARRSLQGFRGGLREKDVLAMYALCRPGLMDRIRSYQINSQCSYETYGVCVFDEILADTCGVLIYQEQCIEFLQRFLALSPNASVKAFRALQHRKAQKIQQLRSDFRRACREKGIREKTGDRVWEEISFSAPLLMSKSHIICYERIAVVCAYLKAHYRDTFMKYHQLLNHDS